MGDADNALPPSKKRAAGRELSRDTPIDDEEDVPEPEAGTFKKASDEVMATRRIVKVRRQQSNSTPSTNPFAGIRLVSPSESSAKPVEEATPIAQSTSENTVAADTKCADDVTNDSEKAKEGDVKQLESKANESGDKSAEIKDAAEENTGEKSEVDKQQRKDHDKNDDEEKNDAEDKETTGEVDKEQTRKNDDEDKKDAEAKGSAGEVEKEQTGDGNDTVNDDKKENTIESQEPVSEGSLKSFQQLSSSQNAFSGLAGTGFSSSSFSFGSLSNEGSALGSGSGSIFGMKNDKPFGLGLSNNGSSVFGATGASATAKGEGSGFPTMQEVVVETGEENEKAVFSADSVLFEFVEGSWKERGKGEVKVNISTGGNEKARLVMRTRGNYRLILNARLYPDIKLTNMDKKGVTFACINSANEGKDGLSTFALKFKDGSIVEEFKGAVTAHKGEKATALKTPENSPKASDG